MVVARGGAIRVVAIEKGTVVLEVTGSPGAVNPLVSRIEAQLRAAVPEVSAIRVVGPSDELARGDAGDDFGRRLADVIETEINPIVAAHQGHIAVVDIHDGWVRIRLEGGCQGCSLAEVTVRQGIELLLRARFSEMVGVVDVTDHAAGNEPFFSPEKR